MRLDSYNSVLRARNRRISRTIIYSCVAGALAWCVGSFVHSFLIGAIVSVLTLLHYTRQLEQYCRVHEIGE
jgi:Flp pilus assembly protein TadB